MHINDMSGYMNIDGHKFVYNVSDHIVSLLPAVSDDHFAYEYAEDLKHREVLSEYLYGTCNYFRVAFNRNKAFFSEMLSPKISFSTPIIIKSAGNAQDFYDSLTEDWNKYHSITFIGGSLNSIMDPSVAVIDHSFKPKDNGTRNIMINGFDEYTHRVNVDIDGEKAELLVSVAQAGEKQDTKNLNAYVLGELNTILRLSFDKEQSFESLEKYYLLIHNLVSLLIGQRNVTFDVTLHQRTKNGQLIKTADCDIYNNKDNYVVKNARRVIPIVSILDVLPTLVDWIDKSKVTALLELLPDDNRLRNKFSIRNIQDLCSALEVAYTWSKRSRGKDKLIAELKDSLKITIDNFIKNHDGFDPYSLTTISSAFEYLDFTAKNRVLTLYEENKSIADSIHKLYATPELDEESIGKFIKLRNNRTHNGGFLLDESAQLYGPLKAVVYSELLKNIGVKEDIISTVLYQLFL